MMNQKELRRLLLTAVFWFVALDVAWSIFPLYIPHEPGIETTYHQNKNAREKESEDRSRGILGGFILRGFSFIKSEHDAFEAGGTLFLALFTAALCIATYFQYRGVRDSVGVAEKAAEALTAIERAWVFPAASNYEGSADTP